MTKDSSIDIYQPLHPQGSAFHLKPLSLRRSTSRRIHSLLDSRKSTKWKPPDGLTGNRQRFGALAELLRSSTVALGGNITGDGHGYVKARGGSLGDFIVCWRLPESEGGATVIDNWASSERLSDHTSDLW